MGRRVSGWRRLLNVAVDRGCCIGPMINRYPVRGVASSRSPSGQQTAPATPRTPVARHIVTLREGLHRLGCVSTSHLQAQTLMVVSPHTSRQNQGYGEIRLVAGTRITLLWPPDSGAASGRGHRDVRGVIGHGEPPAITS